MHIIINIHNIISILKKMGKISLLKSPKKEEQHGPVSGSGFETDFKGSLGIKKEGDQDTHVMRTTYDEFNWDHLIEWEHEHSMFNDKDQASGVRDQDHYKHEHKHEDGDLIGSIIKGEICGMFWQEDAYEQEEDERQTSLNLNLNYQEVIDAWSDRGPCRADDFGRSTSDNRYMGEVPVMKDVKTKREASVLKYKKKRQNRLFSTKIRYEVRKLNADKRPRLKGRFVKRE
ncbi:hypothetical protein R6Q57_017677 [Mikania cordata]